MMLPPDGRALVWIYEHCLRYPTTYDIPLRHMYTINCNSAYKPRPTSGNSGNAFSQQKHRHSNSTRSTGSADTSNSNEHSDTTPRSSADIDEIDGAHDFNAMMENHVARLPSQPCSMSVVFLLKFLRGCFTENSDDVDFNQALSAIDWMRDLHIRWKKGFDSALAALGITRTDLEELDHGQLAAKFPTSIGWLWDMFAKAHNLEAMYGQLYLNLRRWTLINEILLEPKARSNHLALLNSLYPPIMDPALLPEKVTPRLIQMTRDGFFQWVDIVHKNCANVKDFQTAQKWAWDTLHPIFRDQAPEGEKTTWLYTYHTIQKYLNLAENVTAACEAITLSRAPVPEDRYPSDLIDEAQPAEEIQPPNEALSEFRFTDEPQSPGGSQRSKKTRKADSGISFGSSSSANRDKPLPDFPVIQDKPRKVSGLERLAGELKRIGFSKPKSLKKMKSTSTLNFRSPSQLSHTDSNFEVDEDMRRRLIEQARYRKNSNASSSASAAASASQAAGM